MSREDPVPMATLQALGAAIGRSFGSYDTSAGLHGRIEEVKDNGTRRYEGWVLPKLQAWEMHDLVYGDRLRCNPLDGLLIEHPRERTEFPSVPPRRYSLPDPLKLLVPGELPIWGRWEDNWRIAAAEETDDGSVLHLMGLRNQAERGTVVLSAAGYAIRYETPWSSMVATDVREIDDRRSAWWGPLSQGG